MPVSGKAPNKTLVRKREPDSENDEPARLPKRAIKIENAGVKREPIVISDDDSKPILPRKTAAGKGAKAGLPVGRSSFHDTGDEDKQTVEALEASREEPQKMRLCYPERPSKKRYAKRILGVRPLGQTNEQGLSEHSKNNSLNRLATNLSGDFDVPHVKLKPAAPTKFTPGWYSDRSFAIHGDLELRFVGVFLVAYCRDSCAESEGSLCVHLFFIRKAI